MSRGMMERSIFIPYQRTFYKVQYSHMNVLHLLFRAQSEDYPALQGGKDTLHSNAKRRSQPQHPL